MRTPPVIPPNLRLAKARRLGHPHTPLRVIVGVAPFIRLDVGNTATPHPIPAATADPAAAVLAAVLEATGAAACPGPFGEKARGGTVCTEEAFSVPRAPSAYELGAPAPALKDRENNGGETSVEGGSRELSVRERKIDRQTDMLWGDKLRGLSECVKRDNKM